MKSINIMLNSIDRVKKFVNVVNRYDGEFDLVLGKYVIDAKSIMGIFSLDLGSQLTLNIVHCTDTNELLLELKEFEV